MAGFRTGIRRNAVKPARGGLSRADRIKLLGMLMNSYHQPAEDLVREARTLEDYILGRTSLSQPEKEGK